VPEPVAAVGRPGATEHIGLDHLTHVGAYTADWIDDTVRELDGTPPVSSA
jgi:hypothetical protein